MQAVGRAMDDAAGIGVDADRSEILVFRLFELVKAHAGAGGIDLQVERRRLDLLLLVAGQSR
jgi:hypothetical protein